MPKRETKALLRQSCDNLMKECISLSFDFLPLPNPPLEIPDFPARPPNRLSSLIQQALGISSIDNAGFLYRLNIICDLYEPSYIKRHIDPETERENWLSKNIENISERILILQIKDWLYSALDEESPDTERWYLSISVLIGLSLKGSSITESECFNLFECIIFARKPGQKAIRLSGRHHITWDGKSNKSVEEIGHPSGVLAANSVLDILQLYQTNHETVLPHWLERLSVSKHVTSVLNIPLRVQSIILDSNRKNSESLVLSLIIIMSHSPESAKEILFQICNSDRDILRRNLASNLSRIDSEDRDFCISLFEKLIKDIDSDTRVLSTTYLGSLARLDKKIFCQFAKEITEYGDARMIQRLIDSGLRHYLSLDTDDSDNLVPKIWIICNQESKSQLSGMMLGIFEVNPESFFKISSQINHLDLDSHRDLVDRITLRNKKLGDSIRNNQ